MAFPAERRKPAVVCGRVTDSRGCWISLGQAHSLFLRHVPYATLIQQTKKARIRRRVALPEERQALAAIGAIRRQSPLVQLFKVDSLVRWLRRSGKQQKAVSALEQLAGLPVFQPDTGTASCKPPDSVSNATLAGLLSPLALSCFACCLILRQPVCNRSLAVGLAEQILQRPWSYMQSKSFNPSSCKL